MRRDMRHQRPTGFTLIEVMIVVAIVGILAAIGYPSYREHLVRGKLVDATNGLAAIKAETERFYQDNRRYDNVPSTSFYTPCDSQSSVQKTYGVFKLSCVQTSATAFTVQATSTDNAVKLFVFTINEQGVQKTTAADTASGWNTCQTAWLLKKGQTCPP